VAAATNLAFCVSGRRELVDRHGGIAAPGKTEEEVPAEMISLGKIRSSVPELLSGRLPGCFQRGSGIHPG
jgi:hypothetical protein